MRKCIALFILLMLAPLAQAQTQPQELQAILQILGSKPLVRADFNQEKTIAALKKPLLSSGRMVFQREAGVLWRLATPVQAELVVTRTAILQKTARTQSRIKLGGSPYGAATSSLLQLLSGDMQRVENQFLVDSAERQGKGWTLSLRPKDPTLAKIFTRLNARGDEYLRELTMQEPNGGRTLLRFSNPQAQPAALTAEEQALFDLLD